MNPLIARQPWQVFDWLVTAPDAAENRELISGNLAVTCGTPASVTWSAWSRPSCWR